MDNRTKNMMNFRTHMLQKLAEKYEIPTAGVTTESRNNILWLLHEVAMLEDKVSSAQEDKRLRAKYRGILQTRLETRLGGE